MSLEYILYFIDVLTGLGFTLGFLFFCSISYLGALLLILFSNGGFFSENVDLTLYKKNIKTAFLAMSIIGIFSILIPQKQTMYAITLTRYSKQSDIPQMVIKVIEKKLDEIIKYNK